MNPYTQPYTQPFPSLPNTQPSFSYPTAAPSSDLHPNRNPNSSSQAQAIAGPSSLPTPSSPSPSSPSTNPQPPDQEQEQEHEREERDHRPMVEPHQDLQQFLKSFWIRQMDVVEREEMDGKGAILPLARIKKVMKSDEEVRMISAEVPVMFSKACEVFISELTCRAWLIAESHKRRTLQKSDVAAAIAFSDMFDFLIDIVPRGDERGEGGGDEADGGVVVGGGGGEKAEGRDGGDDGEEGLGLVGDGDGDGGMEDGES